MDQPSFPTLLYRYFFFEWLFKDVRKGNLLERNSAWLHNQSQAHWLIVYMRRWLGCAVLLCGLGACFEILMGSPLLSAPFYVLGCLSVTGEAVIATTWLGLKFL